MSDYLEDVDFACDSFHITLILDFIFFENLNGYFLACEHVCPKSYLSKSALTQRPA